MAANIRVQRITLQPEGSPVCFDGTIIEACVDGRRIKVRFDGPLDDLVLIAHGEHKMVSNGVDGKGEPTEVLNEMVMGQYWKVR